MVTAGRSPLPIKVGVGMPVIRMPGISSRSERMVGCGHSHAGSITFSTSPPQWESCRSTNARPGCARSGSSGLLAWREAADVAVAQAVEDHDDKFAGHRDPGAAL